MKRLSQIYRPTLVIPKDAKVKQREAISNSQRLLLECGLVRPTAPGCFAYLPLALRSLRKLEALVGAQLDGAGAQRVLLPALAKADAWRKTGRLGEMGDELFVLRDRHDSEYLLSPTHEEVITELLAENSPLSHKQLPLILYQMSSKYRDERRPRHGLLRSRELLMCDAYSFHADDRCAQDTYARLTKAYDRIFHCLGVPYHRVTADSGPMGGSTSHEYHYASAAGEDALSLCVECGASRRVDGARACRCDADTDTVHSIEVAHTFILGTRYSEPLAATCGQPPRPLVACCYGVGLSRALAACLEVLSGDALRWPWRIAPYAAVVIPPKEGSKEYTSGGRELSETLTAELMSIPGLGDDILLDDRNNLTVGKRLLDADKMGYPVVIVVGRKGLELHTHTTTPQIYSSQQDIVQAFGSLVREMNGLYGDNRLSAEM